MESEFWPPPQIRLDWGFFSFSNILGLILQHAWHWIIWSKFDNPCAWNLKFVHLHFKTNFWQIFIMLKQSNRVCWRSEMGIWDIWDLISKIFHSIHTKIIAASKKMKNAFERLKCARGTKLCLDFHFRGCILKRLLNHNYSPSIKWERKWCAKLCNLFWDRQLCNFRRRFRCVKLII